MSRILSTLVFISIFLLAAASSVNESNWILVADPLSEHPWWHKDMPMKGQ